MVINNVQLSEAAYNTDWDTEQTVCDRNIEYLTDSTYPECVCTFFCPCYSGAYVGYSLIEMLSMLESCVGSLFVCSSDRHDT